MSTRSYQNRPDDGEDDEDRERSRVPTVDDVLRRKTPDSLWEDGEVVASDGPAAPSYRTDELLPYDISTIEDSERLLMTYTRVLALLGAESEMGQTLDFEAATGGPPVYGSSAPFSLVLLDLRANIRELLVEVEDKFQPSSYRRWISYHLDILHPKHPGMNRSSTVTYHDLAERDQVSRAAVAQSVRRVNEFVEQRLEQGVLTP
jgi:hypothetical protein